MQAEQPPTSAPPFTTPATGLVAVFALLLIEVYLPGMAFEALHYSGFYDWVYGPDAVARAGQHLPPPSPTEPLPGDPDRQRLNLWALAVAFPLQAVAAPILLHLLLRVRPAWLGLTTSRLARNLKSGAVGFVLLTPVVFAVHLAVQALVIRSGAGEVQEHPLTRLAHGGLAGAEWVLLVFSAVIQAPVVEEIIFRGMLQRLFSGYRLGGHTALAAAIAFPLASRWTAITEAIGQGLGAVAAAGAPVLFAAAMVPPFVMVCRGSPSPQGPAVFGTALLFATIHSNWPSPVALFVLALGLGRLASRTGSLAGPILLHSLFNGVSCMQLLMGMA